MIENMFIVCISMIRHFSRLVHPFFFFIFFCWYKASFGQVGHKLKILGFLHPRSLTLGAGKTRQNVTIFQKSSSQQPQIYTNN